MLANRGLTTPPTKLQPFFFGVCFPWKCIDPKHSLHLFSTDLSPSDQCSDHLAVFLPREFIEMTAHVRRTIIQTTHDKVQLTPKRCLAGQGLTLRCNMRDPLAQPGHTRLACGLVDQPRRLTIKEPGSAVPQLAPLPLQRAPCWPLALPRGVVTTCKVLPESLGLGEQGADCRPYGPC